MIQLRKADKRGHANYGWLKSYHTFSFADYFDPKEMGFSHLRVINDDTVAPGAGFPTHPHRDMEIVSYVLEGGLEHKDSMGNGSVIRPGDVQRMTAGTGVTHSEYNASSSEPVHFLQIWIVPDQARLEPGYEQRIFEPTERRGRLRLVGSRDGRDNSITIHQDVDLYSTVLAAGESTRHALQENRCAYLHVARGNIKLNGTELHEGDGARVIDETEIQLDGTYLGEVLLFDLPVTKTGSYQ
ncbi:MAG: quercetin 2,3-dioxygenase [Acidithiobacillales bacterium SG8_45]|jgi:redox-sensitive bicupin YhaK (pirin superfamily)|nr:MAG: quercetin 2,3-dioxygenase [Acidithiobacillales bacterium SG8_45]